MVDERGTDPRTRSSTMLHALSRCVDVSRLLEGGTADTQEQVMVVKQAERTLQLEQDRAKVAMRSGIMFAANERRRRDTPVPQGTMDSLGPLLTNEQVQHRVVQRIRWKALTCLAAAAWIFARRRLHALKEVTGLPKATNGSTGIYLSSERQDKRRSDFWLPSIPEDKETPADHQAQQRPVPSTELTPEEPTNNCSAPATVPLAAAPLQKAPNSRVAPVGEDARRAVAKAADYRDKQQRDSIMRGRWSSLLTALNADSKMLRLSSSRQDAMESCLVAVRLMDAHVLAPPPEEPPVKLPQSLYAAALMEDSMGRWFDIQCTHKAGRSRTEGLWQSAIGASWTSLMLSSCVQLIIGSDEGSSGVVDAAWHVMAWMVLLALHHSSWSESGLSSVHAALARSLLSLCVLMVACSTVAAMIIAVFTPLATFTAVVSHQPFWRVIGGGLSSMWSTQAVYAVLAMDAIVVEVTGHRFAATLAKQMLSLVVPVITCILVSICGLSTHMKSEVDHLMIKAPLEAQCAWLAMLQPVELLLWLQRLWWQVPRMRKQNWMVNSLTAVILGALGLCNVFGSAWLWTMFEVPARMGCMHKQRLAILCIVLLVAIRTMLVDAEGGTTMDLSDVDTQRREDTATNAVGRKNFHAATIKVWLPDTEQWVDMLVDLGAATSVMKASTLGKAATHSWRLTRQISNLIAANGMSIGKVLGRASVRMQFNGKEGPMIEHSVSVVESRHVPDLLGVDFFDKYGAEVSFATKSLHLQLGSQSMEVPFSVDGHDFNSKVVSNVQQDCTAKAVARDKVVILPGFQVVLRADVQSASRALHRSQAFIVETSVAAEIRTSHGDADDLESNLKKLLGVMRAIPRALVAPTWEEGDTGPSVALKLENRGTETISIQPGQTLAQLTEVQLHEGDSDDIISLEELKQEGMSPLQMARAGIDGDILGKDDWRSSKAGN